MTLLRATVLMTLQLPVQYGFVGNLNGMPTSKSTVVSCTCVFIYIVILYSLTPSIGMTNKSSGQSCKDIKDHWPSDCIVKNGVYWVQNIQVRTYVYKYSNLCMYSH